VFSPQGPPLRELYVQALCFLPVTARHGVAPEGTAQLEVALPSADTRVGATEGRAASGSDHHRVDPRKRSATIKVINERQQTIGHDRFGTDSDTDGYKAMLAAGRRHKDREWAVEGCTGTGRHVAQRLVANGETVVGVPAKPSARARVLATGRGRKTDPVDARSVAVVALRTTGQRQVQADDTTECGLHHAA
jgi:hypothetical protein